MNINVRDHGQTCKVVSAFTPGHVFVPLKRLLRLSGCFQHGLAVQHRSIAILWALYRRAAFLGQYRLQPERHYFVMLISRINGM